METFSSFSTGHGQENSQESSQLTQRLYLRRHELIQEIKVLIVENSPDCQYFWEVLFQCYGAIVIVCGSVKEALASLDNCVPDILICEIRFIDESVGLLIDQTKRTAVDNDREIPIIVTSTYDLADFNRDFSYLTEKIAAYFLKPIDINDFINTALKLLHAQRSAGHPVITNSLR